MNIIIDCGTYHLNNLGDVAMLKTTVQRLRSFWPNASLFVLTSAPGILATLIPGVIPLSVASRDLWLAQNRKYVWRGYKMAITEAVCLVRLLVSGTKADHFATTFISSHAVISSGGGYLNDLFQKHAFDVLDMISLAQKAGKKTALFGQGIGPINSPELLDILNTVARRLVVLGLRDAKYAKPLSEKNRHAILTGDDSLALAYKDLRKNGENLGINIRKAYYSGIKRDYLEKLKSIVATYAKSKSVKVVPLPISFLPGESDMFTFKELFPKSKIHFSFQPTSIYTLAEVMNLVSSCKVTVTASYHTAIFSLARGIPVVGLTASTYYKDKFDGLARLFQQVVVIDLSSAAAMEQVTVALKTLWTDAPRLRQPILRRVRQQIKMSEKAYTIFRNYMNKANAH